MFSIKEIIGDVRTSVISMITTGALLFLASIGGAIWKSVKAQPVPWVFLILIGIAGIALFGAATIKLIKAEKKKEQAAPIVQPVPSVHPMMVPTIPVQDLSYLADPAYDHFWSPETSPPGIAKPQPPPDASRLATRKPINLTPSKIVDEIHNGRPLQKSDRLKSFVGAPVDWIMLYESGEKDEDNEQFCLTFREGRKFALSSVFLCLPIKGNEYLKWIDKGEKFRITGLITSANELGVFLKDATIERIS